MDLTKNLTPALLAYDGIQYTYMAPAVFEDGQFDYVQEHLRILSGFYGVVKPLDGAVPYRLEMQAKATVGGHKNLYDFWGDSLYKDTPYETEEGCLSLSGVRKTTRYQNIEVEYYDSSWKKHRQSYSGWTAQIIQHECDHLAGIII